MPSARRLRLRHRLALQQTPPRRQRGQRQRAVGFHQRLAVARGDGVVGPRRLRSEAVRTRRDPETRLLRQNRVQRDEDVERAAVIGGCSNHCGVVGNAVQRVHEVHPRVGAETAEQRIGRNRVQTIPLHLRTRQRVGDPFDPTRNDAKASIVRVFVAAVEEHLHPHADAEEGSASRDGIVDDLLEAVRTEGIHARAERPDAGQHHCIRIPCHRTVGREFCPCPRVFQCLLCRTEVADAVIEDRDVWPGHERTPLVEGTPADSMRTASRRQRARPLNEASMMW